MDLQIFTLALRGLAFILVAYTVGYFWGASRSSPFAQIHLLLLHDPESFWHMIVGGYTYPDDNKVELFNWLTGW